MKHAVHSRETQYGFEFGDARVERCFSHKGAVCVSISSIKSHKFINVYLSPTGRTFFVSKVGRLSK